MLSIVQLSDIFTYICTTNTGVTLNIHVISQGQYNLKYNSNQVHVYPFLHSKACLKRPLKNKTKIGFQDQLLLNAVQKYCRMLQESILQYFRPSLSYHLSLRPLFCLFLSGRLRQVLLYSICMSMKSWTINFGTMIFGQSCIVCSMPWLVSYTMC